MLRPGREELGAPQMLSLRGGWLRSDMTKSPEEIAEQLKEAFSDTLRRLPAVAKPGQLKSAWPDVVQNYWEVYGVHEVQTRRDPPTAAAISRLDEALGWLWLIEDSYRRPIRKIVVARAAGVKWLRMEHRFGKKRATLKRWWLRAIYDLAEKLREKAA